MQAATKACPQLPCTFSDTQMGEMITCGLMVTHVLVLLTFCFSPTTSNETLGTERCECPRLLIRGLLLQPEVSVILFENWLKVKRICSIRG